MSNMDDIIDCLQNSTIASKKRWIDSKTGWKNLHENEEINTNIFEVVNNIMNPPNEGMIRTHFTIVKKNDNIWAWRVEEALERFIVIAQPENFRNQYNINPAIKKESIDLVTLNNNKLETLIELKPWKSNNSPAYAFIELVKNYCLLKNKHTIETLILLAPKDYYGKSNKGYFNEASINRFFEIINTFNEQKIVKFKLAYIDLKEYDFNKIITKIGENNENNWEDEVNSDQFEYRMMIEPRINDITDIQKPLLCTNWKFINDVKDWKELCT